jgi:hypothetical protein
MPTDWYEIVEGQDLETGDVISECPIYSVIFPDDPAAPVTQVDYASYDVVVLSQSCDLVAGREKLSHVVLCPIVGRSQLDASHPLSSKGALLKAVQNKEPAFFILETSDHIVRRELSIVHFRQVFTLPVVFLRRIAEQRGRRLRLRSPYKEALATRFAAFFARVGLPQDIRL